MKNPSSIRVTVNDKSIEVQSGCTIAELLSHLQIKSRAIAVELNQEIQVSNQFDRCVLQMDDRLEIVTLEGGG